MTNDCTFAEFLRLASNPIDDEFNMSMTRDGLDNFYSILEHFSEGGTIHNFKFNDVMRSEDEIRAVLAVGWLDVQRFIEYKENGRD